MLDLDPKCISNLQSWELPVKSMRHALQLLHYYSKRLCERSQTCFLFQPYRIECKYWCSTAHNQQPQAHERWRNRAPPKINKPSHYDQSQHQRCWLAPQSEWRHYLDPRWSNSSNIATIKSKQASRQIDKRATHCRPRQQWWDQTRKHIPNQTIFREFGRSSPNLGSSIDLCMELRSRTKHRAHRCTEWTRRNWYLYKQKQNQQRIPHHFQRQRKNNFTRSTYRKRATPKLE